MKKSFDLIKSDFDQNDFLFSSLFTIYIIDNIWMPNTKHSMFSTFGCC